MLLIFIWWLGKASLIATFEQRTIGRERRSLLGRSGGQGNHTYKVLEVGKGHVCD